MATSLRFSVLCLIVFLLASCANPYKQNYRPWPGFAEPRSHDRYDHSESGLQIYGTNNFERDTVRLIANGYWPIGQSSFQAAAAAITEQNLRTQAQEIGAHAVLVNTEYSHTNQGAVPVNVPQQQTTYYSGTATATGSGGYATARSSGTATTYSSSTALIPFSIDKYQVGALYFAKVRHRLGLAVVPLTPQERRELGSNSGLRVFAVVEDTPAFYADFFAGDYIYEVAGERPYSIEGYNKMLAQHVGNTIDIVISRDGETLTKSVRVQKLSTEDRSSSTQRKPARKKNRSPGAHAAVSKDVPRQHKDQPLRLEVYLRDVTVKRLSRADKDLIRRQYPSSRRDWGITDDVYLFTPHIVWTVPDDGKGIAEIHGTLRIEHLERNEGFEVTDWNFEHDIDAGQSVIQRDQRRLFVDSPEVEKDWVYRTDPNYLGVRFYPAKVIYLDGEVKVF